MGNTQKFFIKHVRLITFKGELSRTLILKVWPEDSIITTWEPVRNEKLRPTLDSLYQNKYLNKISK